VSGSARKHVVGRVKTQGIGRAPREEVVAASKQILDALDVQLGDGPFFFGAEPSTYDATAYAFAAGALCPAFQNELQAHAATKKNLVAYEARVKEKYWS
jgi:glutathione S-transferase